MSHTPKFVVCPSCEGEGAHGPGFVYTSEDIDRDFAHPDDFDEHMRDIRNGVFDSVCDWCKGKRVVTAVNENGKSANEAWREECEYRADVAAEARYFGNC